jgi:hypothetical protein
MAKKDKSGGETQAETQDGVRLSAHPRAREHLALAKGWGGIVSFVVVAAAAYAAGLPMTDLLLRALLAGIIGSMLAWGLTLAVWRHLALAQIEGLRRKLVNEIEAKKRELEAGESAGRAALEQRVLAEAERARDRAPEGALNPGG